MTKMDRNDVDPSDENFESFFMNHRIAMLAQFLSNVTPWGFVYDETALVSILNKPQTFISCLSALFFHAILVNRPNDKWI